MSALAWRDEQVLGWGMAVGGQSRVLRPTTAEQIAESFADVRARGGSIALRGAGCSYGDAATSNSGHVLDLSRMNRLLAFDPETGLATVEPGVTVRDLWRCTLPHGWWPRVVSGTSFPTLGGIAAANIHGKNNFAVGTVGDAILEFDLLDAQGNLHTCSRARARASSSTPRSARSACSEPSRASACRRSTSTRASSRSRPTPARTCAS